MPRNQTLAQAKRFIERWNADQTFRSKAEHDPNLQDYRPLWEGGAETALVQAYRARLAKEVQRRAELRSRADPKASAFRIWRERQIKRCHSELDKLTADSIIHHPAAFELTQGCSVGCWFCALAPEKLTKTWSYEQNKEIWKRLLQAFEKSLGPAAAQSMCYWATDPLDNPDYELFIKDFHELLGQFPPTTTAQAHRDLERTRKLLHLGGVTRFSVLTVKHLAILHEAFSAEDLLDIDLVIQTKHTTLKRANAGRARKREVKGPDEPNSTCACVSGFLVNLPEGNIKLITPCNASDQWPLGFKVVKESNFETVFEFSQATEHMMDLPTSLNLDEKVGLRNDLSAKACSRGFVLQNHHREQPYLFDSYPAPEQLVQGLQKIELTYAELALQLEAEGAALPTSIAIFNRLFADGMLHVS